MVNLAFSALHIPKKNIGNNIYAGNQNLGKKPAQTSPLVRPVLVMVLDTLYRVLNQVLTGMHINEFQNVNKKARTNKFPSDEGNILPSEFEF